MNQMENRQFVIYSACCCVHGSFFFFTEDINEKLVLQNGNANASKRVSHLYLSVLFRCCFWWWSMLVFPAGNCLLTALTRLHEVTAPKEKHFL